MAIESVSTWRQPRPTSLSDDRDTVLADLANTISGMGRGRLRVAIDGSAGAGKTSFGHELAAALRDLGRSTLRASLDDFKRPWREARELGYDRSSGEGYYRNAHDFAAARDLLLVPAGQDGSGQVVLCARDPLTGKDHSDIQVHMPSGAVLVVDSVFALRPEYNEYWDFRIRLEVDPDRALARAVLRDSAREGAIEALRLHRDRYGVAERIYLREVRPETVADVLVDNRDLAHPRVLSEGAEQG